MNAPKGRKLQKISRQAEEQNLAKTLQVIHRNVETYGRDVDKMRDEIDDMLEHFHDDNPELINTLENTLTMHDHMKRALERNIRAQKKPYFGRIIFHDEVLNKEESLYIGKGGISEDATHPVVIDWRAPVANAYYENGLGKCSYPSPDGKQIKIDLLLKRTYEMEDGKLLEYFDSEVISNDDLLTKYLAQNKQAVLGDIVATIQQEQNAIIRKTPYHNVVVQGVAGSGKTTVAMHRISYILYNYAERFKPDDFYIVGSNRILLNYITGVLPNLDVYGVRQMTMEQLFVRLLYEDWDETKYSIQSTDRFGKRGVIKGSLSWFRDLEKYCERLEWNAIPRESIYLNPRQYVEGLRDGKSGVYDMTDEKPAAKKDLVLLMDQQAVERYILQNPTVSVQSKINMLNERLNNKVKEEFWGKGVKYTEPEKKAITRAYRGKYGAREWKKSIFTMYKEFLKEQLRKGHAVDIPDTAFDVYDLAALAYLYKRIKETEVISEAHHVVIDEAQDFGMMAYSVLKFCIKDCTYTIMGDVSQNIHFGFGLNDWEELKQLYLPDEKDSFSVLKKSYRNTIEISQFATRILEHGQFSTYPVDPIIRHGNPVRVLEVSEAEGEEELMKEAAQVCRDWQERGLETIAVVCRSQEKAQKTAEKLGQLIEIMESDLEKAEFGNGIMVLPVEYTKGLEFDAVLILDPTREEYPSDDGHAKLLYVAATRALHELCVLHGTSLTGLIADPIPEKKKPVSENAEVRKNAITENTSTEHRATATHSRPSVQPVKKRAVIVRSADPAPQPSVSSESMTRYFSSTAGKSNPQPAVRGVSDRLPVQKTPEKGTAPSVAPDFGDIPPTEKLRLGGHPKIDGAIRWVSKQPDGLYLQSRYGVLRISPVESDIIRITFAKGDKIQEKIHPGISAARVIRSWMYKESPKTVELKTDDLYLQVEKATGAISYYTRDKKLLLSERNKEPRLLQTVSGGQIQGMLYPNWQKGENLYGINAGEKSSQQTENLKLRGTARYLSQGSDPKAVPFLLSDKGYGIVMASSGPTFCCDMPAYGSYLYAESEMPQMDYYFIAGMDTGFILSAYNYLRGRN